MIKDPVKEKLRGLKRAKSKVGLKRNPPPLYEVVLLNDDFTPMEFVVEILMSFFGMSQPQSVQVMLAIHNKGKGLCGKYTRDVAETKVLQVNQHARNHNYPLLCAMEVAE